MKREIVGLTINDRFKLAWIGIKALFVKNNAKDLIDYYANNSETSKSIISNATNPSKEMFRKAVEEMPYSPFGVPGLTDTTKFSGNLSEQFPAPLKEYPKEVVPSTSNTAGASDKLRYKSTGELLGDD